MIIRLSFYLPLIDLKMRQGTIKLQSSVVALNILWMLKLYNALITLFDWDTGLQSV